MAKTILQGTVKERRKRERQRKTEKEVGRLDRIDCFTAHALFISIRAKCVCLIIDKRSSEMHIGIFSFETESPDPGSPRKNEKAKTFWSFVKSIKNDAFGIKTLRENGILIAFLLLFF